MLGGRKLDAAFLGALEGAPGFRVLLWRSDNDIISSQGAVTNTGALAPLITEVRRTARPTGRDVEWSTARADSESVLALPLQNEGSLLAVLLVATSLRDQIRLERSILLTGLGVGAAGILIGVLLGWWTTARVTRPVGRLVTGARTVAAGDWSAHVEVASQDEIGELARAFNQMTERRSA